MSELTDKELLKWAINMAEDRLGVFKAGYGIGRDPGNVWHCFGCKGEHCQERDNYDTRQFPHEPGCMYVACLRAIRAAGA